MHFFDRELEERYPEKLLFGGIASTLILLSAGMLAGTLEVFVFAEHVTWSYVVLGSAAVVLTGVLLAVMTARFRHTGRLGAIPNLCLLAAMTSTIGCGAVGLATGNRLLAVGLAALPAVAVGLFGDLPMLGLQWVTSTLVLTWCLVVLDTPQVAGTVVVLAILLAAIEGSINLVLRFLARNLRLSEMFRDIDGLEEDDLTHMQALDACLTRIASSSPQAVVLVGAPERGFRIAVVWPHDTKAPVDPAIAADPDVARVITSGVSIIRSDYAIMPVGQSDEGGIVVAIKRSGGGPFAPVSEVPYDAVQLALERVSMRMNTLQRLRTLGNTDPLTGLLNRRALLERLALEIAHTERDGHPLCLAMVDLDHFKRYNDTYGHPAGDELLKEFGAVFGGRLRRVDSVARYGGEEFCVVLPDIDEADAIDLLDELRIVIAKLQPDRAVSFSAGVTRLRRGESGDDLIARADATLYLAKDRGRNQVLGTDPRSAAMPSS